MATTQELADLSNHIYDAKGKGDYNGWHYEVTETEATGFKGGIYTRGAEKVLAYAGTDPSERGDVVADCQSVSGMLSAQLQDATNLAMKAGK